MILKATIENGLRHYQQTADHASANDACEYIACALHSEAKTLLEFHSRKIQLLADAKALLASARNEELKENFEQCFRDLFAAVDAMYSPVSSEREGKQ